MAGFATILMALTFLPPYVIFFIGCYQIGSWVGNITNKIIENDEK